MTEAINNKIILPKRTIPELIARYRLEPELSDVYVEGIFDKKIIDYWCKKNNNKKIKVYTIDSVDVPSDILISYELTSGNKQRVIALAKKLSISNGMVKFIVDKDLDEWLNLIQDAEGLIFTDFNSLEMYFLSEEIVDYIINDITECKITNWHSFYKSFLDVLKSLYAIRLASNNLNFNFKWISVFKKDVLLKRGCLSLDEASYIKKNLVSNGFNSHYEKFMTSYNEWLGKLNCDPRVCIHGHDFVDLIRNVIKLYKGIDEFNDQVVLSKLFFMYINNIDTLVQRIK
ncbi:hypothetical protein NFC79_12180 [Providencia stuartii]|nr:hypothetical protein NFC79_12180 [Providencia stuartii]